MDCRHLDDLYELFLMGALTAEDRRVVEEHIDRQCTCCLERLREAALSVYFLSQMPRPARLDPRREASFFRHFKKG